jgi:hypothetical protein
MVVVYDFAIAPEAVQLDPSALSAGDAADPWAAQERIASEVQEAITKTLVAQIRDMGLPVRRAGPGPLPRGDVVIVRGQVTNVNLGNRLRRTVVGFGAGQSTVDANVELLYSRDGSRPRPLQTYSAEANSGRAPGLASGWGSGRHPTR